MAAAAHTKPSVGFADSGLAPRRYQRIRIEPHDILWISSADNYVEYALAGGRNHLVRGTLAAEEARLTKFNIVRVHRTRMVNLSRVTGLKAGPNGDFELTLDTGQAIAGSRRYRAAAARRRSAIQAQRACDPLCRAPHGHARNI